MMKIQERVEKILEKLDEGLFEREVPLKLSFLATIAGECFFMLGPPGVAKSLIARRLTKAFKDANLFIYLMNRFSTPDEVFGPYSIHELKDNDLLVRKSEGYLPSANITFLDEIWKASPSIQNTLLTIINEKIFRNGNIESKVNLYGILAASNELPEKDQGLEALWDRFLVRVLILGIEDKHKFEQMITATEDLMNPKMPPNLQISLDELIDWQSKITEIEVPQEVLDVIHYIRNQLREFNEKSEEEQKIIISDRRWKKIINLLRSCAFLNGREKVDLMDSFLISHCIWNEPPQIDQVKIIVRDAIRNHGYKRVIDTESIKHAIEQLDKEVDAETHFIKKIPVKELVEYDVKGIKCYKIQNFSNSYHFIQINDWNQLKMNSETRANFYDNKGNRSDSYYHTNYITKKSNTSLLYEDNIYGLGERERVDEKIETKKPHKAVIDTWNKEVDNIKDKIDEEKKNLQDYVEIDLKHVKSNNFVSQNNSLVVLSKIEDIKGVLNQLEIRLLKIRDTYTNIK